jgi:DNA-binding NarL/FixJ family response regulator
MEGRSFNVLIVEDEPVHARALESVVRSVGGVPVLAATVEAGKAAVMSKEIPGAFLIDVKLTDGSGLVVLQLARKLYPQTPAAIVSGWHFQEIFDAAWDLDAYYFIKKYRDTERIAQFLELAKLHTVATPDRLVATFERWRVRSLRKAPKLAEILRRAVVDGESRHEIAKSLQKDVWTVRDQEEAIATKTGYKTFPEAVMALMREAAGADRPSRLRR